jgi:hypothetical protein
MRADEAEQASKPVERLNHLRDERCVATVSRKHLTYPGFETTDQLVGLLLLLVGHVCSPWLEDNTMPTFGLLPSAGALVAGYDGPSLFIKYCKY